MKLSVGLKLIGGFGCVALLTLVIGFFSILQIAKVNDATREMATNWLPAVGYVGRMNTDVSDIQRLTLRHLLQRDGADRHATETDLRNHQRSFEHQLDLYDPTITSDHERALFGEVKHNYQSYRSIVEAILAQNNANRPEAGFQLVNSQGLPVFWKTKSKVEDLLQLNLDGGAAAAKRAETDFRTSFGITVSLTAVATLLALGLGFLLSRRIVKNLVAVTKAAEEIAQGDLGQEVRVTSQDELGAMAKSFQRMTENLRQIVSLVRHSAFEVATGADQISSATEELSRAAQSQAAAAEDTSTLMAEMAASIQQVSGNAHALAGNVDETSSSIEEMAASITQVAGNTSSLDSAVGQTSTSIREMAASIQQVAGNVQQANQAADDATLAAQEGRHAVAQTIEGMQRINQVMTEVVTVMEGLGQSSSEIGAIIEVIDDIAEQTNLLALNAAIEAARAGDVGRGFAVVADEVRKLAERSAQATREISQLIRSVQQETTKAIASTKQGETAIQEGTRLAHDAGVALREIVTAVTHASDLMNQIRTATGEQSEASALITQEVVTMSTLTQQVNAATREQAKGSEQIIHAVETMNRMTQQVSAATTEQQEGGKRVAMAVEDINRSVQESATATNQIAQSAGDLQAQARGLMEAIAFFKYSPSQPARREIVTSVEVARMPARLGSRS